MAKDRSDGWKIKFTYFKPSGKFYSEGEYMTHESVFYYVEEEIRAMLEEGKRPGLVDGHDGFHVVIDASDHPGGFPVMFPGQG